MGRNAGPKRPPECYGEASQGATCLQKLWEIASSNCSHRKDFQPWSTYFNDLPVFLIDVFFGQWSSWQTVSDIVYTNGYESKSRETLLFTQNQMV